MPLIFKVAKSQITRPAGAATLIALPNTNKVLSKIDLIKIFPNWGLLYGGSSKIKEEGIPFKIVLDNIFDVINVKIIPKSITKITASVETIEAPIPCIEPAIKILEIAIKKGNLPVTRNKIIC